MQEIDAKLSWKLEEVCVCVSLSLPLSLPPFPDSDDSSYAIHLEEDDTGQKLCVLHRIMLAATCFYHNFLLQTQNRVI